MKVSNYQLLLMTCCALSSAMGIFRSLDPFTLTCVCVSDLIGA